MSSVCIKNILRFGHSNLLSQGVRPLAFLQQDRKYAFKSDLTIKWKRPEKIPCIKPEKSGDMEPIASVNVKQFPLEFQKSKELETAPELVQRIFSLEFATRKKVMEIPREELMKRVRRYSHDVATMETRIASMTGEIRNLQQHMEKDIRDRRTKVFLKELIDKRKKFLKYLRRWDYKRFEWLLEKLNIVYKSPPSDYTWVTRKGSLRKLTDKHCADLIQSRLDAYRGSLEAQQRGFLERKLETLQWIMDEEQACSGDGSVTQADIDAVRDKIRQLDEKEKSSS